MVRGEQAPCQEGLKGLPIGRYQYPESAFGMLNKWLPPGAAACPYACLLRTRSSPAAPQCPTHYLMQDDVLRCTLLLCPALLCPALPCSADGRYVEGSEKAQEFFAGYLLEQSLSIDNLFVFVLVFNYFKTPVECQPKVLTYGIATAAVLRLVMILLGVELIQKFEPLLVVFALILLWSAYGLLTKGDDDEDDDLSDNAVVKLCRRVLPVSDHYEGNNFFTTPAAAAAAASAAAASNNGGGSSSSTAVVRSWGGRVATPLLLALAVVEISDVLFAVDSIPAVFGVTLDPFIIYSSNMFAIFSLRSLYSFVSTVMTELRFLDKAVALVLGFIGVKMLLEFADINVPTDVSLLVVGLTLGGGVAASMLLPEDDEKEA